MVYDMRIGELSRRTGFSRDAIRFYERSGLFQAKAREGDNNYKNYPESAVFALETVRDAQAAGMTIEDLTMILKQLELQDDDQFDGDAFLTEKIREVESRIEASSRFLRTLKQTRIALKRAPHDDE